MRSTFSILYYINRGKVKADWTTAIMCRITIDGKSSVFTTGYYCNPECWNTKNGTVKMAGQTVFLRTYGQGLKLLT